MDILNNNIKQYILNQYLNYKTDIKKLHLLYDFKFNIDTHLSYGDDIFIDEENEIIKEKDVFIDSEKLIEYGFYDNGQLNFFHNFKKERNWYKTGELKWEANLKDEKYDGIFREWYKNGNEEYTGKWINGEREGIHIFYYLNGNIRITFEYKDNKSVKRSVYDENGKLIEKEIYDRDI
jgi:antitoxin component YwqK of YwqJK toxin-antitoxin module